MSQKVNIALYRNRAYRKKKALTAFLKKLAKSNIKGLTKLTAAAEKATWEKINCQNCGNCCMTMTPTWKKSEVKKLATHLGMTYDEFYQKWLYTEESTGDIMNDSARCMSLGLTTVLLSLTFIERTLLIKLKFIPQIFTDALLLWWPWSIWKKR
ncbi:MAG: hypothetical protein RL204_1538 [Bacteroidota bacterium]